MNPKLVLLSVILQAFTFHSFSQTYLLSDNSSQEIETDQGVIYDNGGRDGNYSNSFDGIITIRPATAGKKISLLFNSFSVESCCDRLVIYNGPSTNSEQIGVFTDSPGIIYSTDDSGALTLYFSTDGSITSSGFEAVISAVDEVPQADPGILSTVVNKDTIVAGGAVEVRNVLFNSGFTTLYNHMLVYYLSNDTILDASDDSLSYYSISSLYSGGTKTISRTVHPDINSLEGNYYILSRFADRYMNKVGDSINDLSYEPIYIEEAKVDLEFSSVELVQNTISYESSMGVNLSLGNEGNTGSGSTYLGYYLSTDLVLDESDSLVYSSYCSSISPQSNSSKSNMVSIDREVGYSSGIYYLIIKADSKDEVTETDETNNLFVTQVLLVDNYSNINPVINSIKPLSDSVSEGGRMMIEYNFGSEDYISGLDVRLFISKDNVLNYDEDYVLRTFSVNIPEGTSKGQWYNSIQSVEDYGIDNGLNYLIAEIDYHNEIHAEDTTDNIVSHPIYVFPMTCYELELKNLEIQTDSVLVGQAVSLKGAALNTCYTNVYDIYAGFYLSEDELFDAGDDYLTYRYFGAMYPGEKETFESQVYLNNVEPGDYNILCVLDYRNYISETDEENNILSVPVKVIDENTVGELDIELSEVLIPESVERGQQFAASLEYFVNDTKSNHVSFACYASVDSVFDASDLENKVWESTNTCQAYKTASYTGYVTIPETVEAGKVYLIFKADDHNVLFEGDESNNVVIKPIELKAISYYTDVVISNLQVPSVVLTSGARLGGTCNISNIGSITADTVLIKAYITEELDSDVPSVNIPVDTLYNLSGAYTGVEIDFLLPDTLVDGTYYLHLYVESKNGENIADSSASIIQKLIGIHSPVIDLTITDLSFGISEVYQGVNNDISYTLINQGSGISQNAKIAFYLSVDDVYSVDDVLLKTIQTNYSGIQTPMQKLAEVEIPEGTIPGAYHIIAIVDPTDEIIETQEDNNAYVISVEVLPSGANLILSNTRLNASEVKIGGNVTLYSTITNVGNLASVSTRVGLYLSNDTIWDQADKYLAYDFISSLGAESQASVYITYYPNHSDFAGTYYLIAKADYQNQQVELNEEDNVAYEALEILNLNIDLRFDQSSSDTLYVIPGSQMQVVGQVRNLGSDYVSGSIYSSIYLSADTVLNPIEDSYLGQDGNYVSLSANGYETETYSYTIPASIQHGVYYGFMEIDNSNDFTELNEENNSLRFPIKVVEPNVDLMISGISLDRSTVSTGEYIYSDYIVQNQGRTSSATTTYSAVYISDDEQLSSDDYRAFTNYTPSIPGGGYSITNRSVYIPTNLNNGTYYLLFVADYNNSVEEVNELNNVVAREITIAEPTYDLVVRNTDLSNSVVTPGDYISISCEVQNVGTSNMQSNTSLGYYLSDDEFLNSSDVYLGDDYVSSLSSGSSSYESFSLNIPSVSAGDYYILFVADYSSMVDEVNESNNTSSHSITIAPHVAGADYLVSDVQFDIDNGMINMGIVVNNIGNSSATDICFTNIILSKDQIRDDNDLLLASYTIHPLRGKAGTTDYLYEPMPIESYNYLIVVVDENNDLTEADETNNTEVVLINENIVDIAHEGPAFIDDTPMNGKFDISTTIFNNSDTTLVGLQIGYYISSDTVLSADDLLSFTRMVSFLNPLEELPVSTTIEVPSGVQPGDYVLLSAIYAGDEVVESDEFNNVVKSRVRITEASSFYSTAIESELTIFPNPASEFIRIESEESILTYSIVNSIGAVVIVGESIMSDELIDIHYLPSGVYLMLIKTETRELIKKFEVY